MIKHFVPVFVNIYFVITIQHYGVLSLSEYGEPG
jgi:hypothetical protein